MPSPILYVCARPQRDAAEAEYESFRIGLGLERGRLDQHDLVRAPLPADTLDRYAAVVVGGSPFNVTDPESQKSDAQRRLENDLERLAEAAAASRIAALYTCYGIGIVSRMLGASVSREHPEATGPAKIELTAEASADPIFDELANPFLALTAHKEGTGAVPAGATLLARNDACPVQAYRVGERLYATQFHPEPTTRDFTQRMVIYRDGGYFDARDFDVVSARVLAADITEPPRMLRFFARRFAD